MNDRQPNLRGPSAEPVINLRSAAATVVAGALGAVTGGLAASNLPSDKFAWTGFALVPLFALIELTLKRVVVLFAGNAQAARFTLVTAIVAAFYAAWFAVRSA